MTALEQPIRPKVFRPPMAAKPKPVRTFNLRKRVKGQVPYVVLGGLFIMLAMSSAPANKPEPNDPAFSMSTAKRIPQISITQEDVPKEGEITTLAMNQPPPNLPPSLYEDGTGRGVHAMDTIVLEGNSSRIVGQMARIPLESEQITEVKPLEDIDNSEGRELLSIINKY